MKQFFRCLRNQAERFLVFFFWIGLSVFLLNLPFPHVNAAHQSQTLSPRAVHPPSATSKLLTEPTVNVQENSALSDIRAESEFYHQSLRSFTLTKEIPLSGKTFFETYRSLFQLSPDDELLSLSDRTQADGTQAEEPRLKKTSHTATAEVFQQYYQGIEVHGAEYTLWEKNGAITSGIGTLAPHLQLDPHPALTQEQALAKVLENLRPEKPAWEGDQNIAPPTGKLMIITTRPDGEFASDSVKLVYHYDQIPIAEGEVMYFDIDAHNGEIVAQGNYRNDDFQNVEIPTSVKDYYDHDVKFTTKQDKGTNAYILGLIPENERPGVAIRCWEARGKRAWNYDKGEFFTQNLANNFHNISCDQAGTAAVSALWDVENIFSYFENTFSWFGYDGMGIEPIDIGLFAGKGSPFFDRLKKRIGLPYFKGVLPSSTMPGYTYQFAVDLETVAHEYTHGISGAIFQPNPEILEMGAINESLSDIMGLIIKNKTFTPPGNSWDWTSEAQIVHDYPPSGIKALRYFADPKKLGHPDTYQPSLFSGQDYDPHVAGEISNHWFYLLSEGSDGQKTNDLGWKYTVLPAGHEVAAQIVFRTLSGHYLHSNDGFMQFRFATLLATEDLIAEGAIPHDSAITVMNAWHAVGVGDDFESAKKYLPYDGQIDISPWPAQLKWQVSYPQLERTWQVRVANNPNFLSSGSTGQIPNVVVTSDPVDTMTTSFSGIVMASANFNLQPNTTYYWQFQTLDIDQSQCPRSPRNIRGGSDPCLGLLNHWGKVNSFRTASVASELVSPLPQDHDIWPWKGKFTWNEVPGAIGYIVQISHQPFQASEDEINFTNIEDEQNEFFNIIDKPNTSGDQTLERVLKINHQYYWRVVALGPKVGFLNINDQLPTEIPLDATFGSWTKTDQNSDFTTALPKTHLRSPNGQAAVSPWRIPVQWEQLDGAQEFRVKIATDPAFQNIIPENKIVEEAGQNQYKNISLPEEFDQKKLWIEADPIGPEPYTETGDSDKQNFTIDYNLTKPLLARPSDGQEVPYHSDVTFSWSSIKDAQKYRLGIDDGPTWKNSIDYPFEVDDTIFTVKNGNAALNKDKGYCWSVRAIGPGNLEGKFPTAWCYSVGPSLPLTAYPPDKSTQFGKNPFSFAWQTDYAPHGFKLQLEEYTNGQYVKVLDDVDVNGPPGNSNNFHYDFGTIKANAHYFWRIGAKTNGGEPLWYPPLDQPGLEFITMPSLQPPHITAVTPHAHSVDITWQEPNNLPLNHYVIFAKTGSNQTTLVNLSGVDPFTIPNLESNANYDLWITSEFKNPLTFLDGSKSQDSLSNDTIHFTTTSSSQSSGSNTKTFYVGVQFDLCGCELEPYLIDDTNIAQPLFDPDTLQVIDSFFPGDMNRIKIAYLPRQSGHYWKLRLVVKNIPPGLTYDPSHPPYINFTKPDGSMEHYVISQVNFENNFSHDFVFQVP